MRTGPFHLIYKVFGDAITSVTLRRKLLQKKICLKKRQVIFVEHIYMCLSTYLFFLVFLEMLSRTFTHSQTIAPVIEHCNLQSKLLQNRNVVRHFTSHYPDRRIRTYPPKRSDAANKVLYGTFWPEDGFTKIKQLCPQLNQQSGACLSYGSVLPRFSLSAGVLILFANLYNEVKWEEFIAEKEELLEIKERQTSQALDLIEWILKPHWMSAVLAVRLKEITNDSVTWKMATLASIGSSLCVGRLSEKGWRFISASPTAHALMLRACSTPMGAFSFGAWLSTFSYFSKRVVPIGVGFYLFHVFAFSCYATDLHNLDMKDADDVRAFLMKYPLFFYYTELRRISSVQVPVVEK